MIMTYSKIIGFKGFKPISNNICAEERKSTKIETNVLNGIGIEYSDYLLDGTEPHGKYQYIYRKRKTDNHHNKDSLFQD